MPSHSQTNHRTPVICFSYPHPPLLPPPAVPSPNPPLLPPPSVILTPSVGSDISLPHPPLLPPPLLPPDCYSSLLYWLPAPPPHPFSHQLLLFFPPLSAPLSHCPTHPMLQPPSVILPFSVDSVIPRQSCYFSLLLLIDHFA